MESKLEMRFYSMILDEGIQIPIRELVFAPPRKWRFDFAWPISKVAVEIHGGVWSNGRHTRGSGYSKDLEKMNVAQKLGWRVFQFTKKELDDGSAISLVKDVMGHHVH